MTTSTMTAEASRCQSDLIVGRISTGVLDESSIGAIFTSRRSCVQTPVAPFTVLIFSTVIHGWVRTARWKAISGFRDLTTTASMARTWPGVLLSDCHREPDSKVACRYRRYRRISIPRSDSPIGPACDCTVAKRAIGPSAKAIHSLREISHGVEVARWEYLDTGLVQSQEISADYISLRSAEGDFARLDYKWQKEGLLTGEQPLEDIGILIPAGEYSFNRWGSFIRTASYRVWDIQLRIDGGDYYNGDKFHVRPEVNWTPNEHLKMSLRLDFNKFEFPGVTAYTRQMTLENEISFNAKLCPCNVGPVRQHLGRYWNQCTIAIQRIGGPGHLVRAKSQHGSRSRNRRSLPQHAVYGCCKNPLHVQVLKHF